MSRYLLEHMDKTPVVHIEGCTCVSAADTSKANKLPKKYKICPECRKMVYILCGDKNAMKNKTKYEKFFKKASAKLLKEFYMNRKYKTEWWGNTLFIQGLEDSWKITTDTEPPVLWHNNYGVNRQGERYLKSGYHEQKTTNKKPVDLIHTILWYKFINKAHLEKKRG